VSVCGGALLWAKAHGSHRISYQGSAGIASWHQKTKVNFSARLGGGESVKRGTTGINARRHLSSSFKAKLPSGGGYGVAARPRETA